MPRAAVPVVLAALLLAAAPARADDVRVRVAADEFDAGRVAFKAKDWEVAAAHFEAADAAVPSANALRPAIRARAEAGQGARAATLAAEALRLYPNDDAIDKLALETLEKLEPLLHKISVTCASPCTLSVGTRVVPGAPSDRWTLYLEAGKESVSASFGSAGQLTSAPARDFSAKAGGVGELRFAPPKGAAPVPAVAPVTAPTDKHDAPPDDPKPDAPTPERKGISPAFFVVGAVATVALGAATVWSGVDTISNPGAAAVMAACHPQGPTCRMLNDEGLAHQTRTNVLIGTTAGVAAVTVVLALFTRWRSDKKPPPVEPTALLTDRGAVLGAAGAF